MTTALQVINGAAEKIGVKTAEVNLEAEDFQVILNEMNDMLTEWADIGLTPAYIEVSDSTAILNIDRNAVNAVKNNLAIRIAPSFQRVVTQALAAIAEDALNRLRASVIFIGEVSYPDTLPTGSGNDCGDIFIDDTFFQRNKQENF